MLPKCLLTIVTTAIALPFLPAQTHVTSPSGLLNMEGDAASHQFGAYAESRHMLFDGEHRSNPMGIKEVAYRDDFRPYTPAEGTGRMWSNVTIDMVECDMASLTPIFAQNAVATPTRVFSGAVTWPTNSGLPNAYPPSWSKRFPLSTTWAYSGIDDICIDHDFQGGTMANSAPWSGSTMHRYFLDGFPTATSNQSQQTFYGRSKLGCIDSSATEGASNFLVCRAFGSNYHDPAFRGKFELYTHSFFTAPGKPVINVVNFVGNPAGIPFPGVTCNRLHLDVTKFLIVNVTTAQSTFGAWSGFVYPTGTANGLIQANPAFTGFRMWAQTVWNDSATSQLKLSRAVSIEIPAIPRALRRSALFQPDPTAKGTVGFGPYTSSDHNPAIRYTR